jgi:hypothetical protein
LVATPVPTEKLSVFDVVETLLSVPVALSVTDPAAFPVTVVLATPATAETVPRPLTDPGPVVWLKAMPSVLSAPVLTVFPAASSIVAINTRVLPDGRLAVDPESTICVAPPTVTVKSSVLEVALPPLTVPLAWRLTVPAPLPVTTIVATPPAAVAEPVPVTDPLPPAWLKVTAAVLSAPAVTVFPAESSIVAVNVRVAPEARLAVDPESTILVAEPDPTSALALVLVAVQVRQTAVTV